MTKQSLARVLLEFLGYDDQTDWEYNINKIDGRPNFLIAPEGRIAFYLEDKNTSTNLSLAQLGSQLRRYAESFAVLGLAFNGREVLATRLNAGRVSPILRVDLFEATALVTEEQLTLDPHLNEVALDVLVELFHRQTFTQIPQRIRTLMCSETDWKAQAQNINQTVDSFGEKCRSFDRSTR